MKMKWEQIDDDNNSARLKVPGGWLVRVIWRLYNASDDVTSASIALAFVPDPEYTWIIEKT